MIHILSKFLKINYGLSRIIYITLNSLYGAYLKTIAF